MKIIFVVFILGVFSTPLFSQNKFTISGSIKDESKGEELINAIVKVKGQNLGTRSNEYGFYSLTLPEGKYTLVVTAMGFVSQEKEIDLNKNLNIDFAVLPPAGEKTQELEEIKVSAIK